MVDPVTAVALFLVVLVMAAVSASVGPAGGVVFAAMAVALPPGVVVPVHAAVQAGGTSVRLLMLGRFVVRAGVVAFAVGGTIGLVPATLLASNIEPPANLVRLGLGFATLAPVVLRRSVGAAASAKRPSGRLGSIGFLGAWTSFLTLYVGATGAVVAASLSKVFPDPQRRVATHTGCLWFQHVAKVIVHVGLGFSLSRFLPLVGLLLVASTVGAVVGRRALTGVPAPTLNALFEIVVLALGGYLVSTGLAAQLLETR